MPRPHKDTIRKSFLLKTDLDSRLIEYSEKSGFTQAQIMNLAIRQFFENEDMKKFLIRADPEKMAKELVEQFLKQQIKAEESGGDEEEKSADDEEK